MQFYSADGSDYLKPHFRSLVYGRWAEGGNPERQLFPRIMPVVLATAALWPPLSVARIAYTLALVTALDGSFGLKGSYYPLLYTYVGPYRGLRVPARFSILVGLTLAVLAGYGAARMFERWPRRRILLTAVTLGLLMVEAMPRMPLERVWPAPPPIYASIASEPSAVLAEFPMPTAPLGIFLRHAVPVLLDVPLAPDRQRQQRLLPEILRRADRARARLPVRRGDRVLEKPRRRLLHRARRVPRPGEVPEHRRHPRRETRHPPGRRRPLGRQRVAALPASPVKPGARGWGLGAGDD